MGDELIESGPITHELVGEGRWIIRKRVGDMWSESEVWLLRGQQSTREEWERR